MQVSIQSGDGLERRIKVQVPAERIEREVTDRLKSMSRNVKVDGFRPGKVPFPVVVRRYGSKVRAEVHGEVVQATLDEAIKAENLRPAGRPRVEFQVVDAGRDLEYTATLEVYPEIGVIVLDQVKVDRPRVELSESDVDTVLERLRKQRAEWVEVERPAQTGDQVTMDFTGMIAGAPFEGNEGRGVRALLGSGVFLKGFEDQLLGLKTGDERTFDVTFSDPYHRDELVGKTAQFTVNVLAVAEPKLPEVDADFIQSFGVESGEMADLRKEVRSTMQRELEQTIRQRVKQQVLEGVLMGNPLSLPQALVESELKQLVEQERRAQEANRSAGPYAPPLEVFAALAQRRVALGLLLSEVISRNALRVSPERLRSLVETSAASYENPAEFVSWYYSNPNLLANIETLALEDEAVEWVVTQVGVNEIPASFDDVMQPRPQGA